MCHLIFLWLSAAVVGLSQTTHPTAAPFDIVSFKIGTDSYPMLDNKPPIMSADNPDFPRLPGEVVARQTRRGERNEEIKARAAKYVRRCACWIKPSG